MKKILIVDDEPGIRIMLKSALEGTYEILTASNGDEAVKIIFAHQVDLMLLDIDMPNLNGIEVLEQLRETATAPQIIMLTTIEKLETAKQALSLGAAEYLTKPFDISRLREIIAVKLAEKDSDPASVPWKVKED